MKKKLFLALALVLFACCLFALSISAAETNEFGAIETSDTIDLSGMSTDTKARVVLFDGTEYHTYPAQYIVTSATDITFNFDKINAAFSKSYVNNSVIRIEIPNTVKVIDSGEFSYGKNNNLKEVFFPSDSQVYKFNWGCFENNTGLEKINIPASMTEYNGKNHFCGCKALKEVTFDQGYSVSYIPEKFFSGCSSLEKLVFPNCVTEIRGGAFSSSAKLKTVIFGNSLQTMIGSMSDCATSGSVWYLPSSFYASNVTSEPPSNMFHWAGGQTNGVSGNNNNPKNITFVYTGTKAEAEALQARFKAADAAIGENCVGLQRIWGATLCTEAEYKELTGKNVGEVGAKGNYIVYGYGVCDAFYDGEHAMSGNATKHFNGYMEDITFTDTCTRNGCGKSAVDESKTIKAVFSYLGFSYTEGKLGGTYSMAQFFGVNEENLKKYEELMGTTLSFGVIAQANKLEAGQETVGAIKPTMGVGKVLYKDFTNDKHNYFEIKVSGISEELKDTKIVFCAYVIENGKMSYLNNNETVEELTGESYNDVVAIKNA
ncbi:MAG: leucine-rich repeat domain-containing protein [Ruminococcaceae bacterium]|nr:leucine-rich repeat domain-containing protein [Oscillospiraceae bacterium]